MYKVAFISLGCAKNQVNAEQMMALVNAAGHGVCAQHTHDCGNAVLDGLRDIQLRTTAAEAAFTASAQYMNMLIDKTRNRLFTCRINHSHHLSVGRNCIQHLTRITCTRWHHQCHHSNNHCIKYSFHNLRF